MEGLFVGIDNGTQGTKTVIFDTLRGEIVSTAYAPHDIITGPNGKKEQDPCIWVNAAKSTLIEALANVNVEKQKIVAISVSGQQHGCVLLDSEGNVLRPAKLWCDTETTEECNIITERVGGKDKVIKLIGNHIAVGYTASKVLWTKIHEPELYSKVRHILLPHDYLNYWLTGNFTTDMGDASGTAYFDIKTRQWSKEILNAIDPETNLESYLPKILKFNESSGKIRPELAKELGIPADVIVGSGGGDNMMAAIGTGNVTEGVFSASLGTSGTVFAYSNTPVQDPEGIVAGFCSSSGGWLPLICTMNVTVATEQTRALFGLSIEEFNREAEKAAPGAGGIIMVPYFNGERTPPRPTATATLAGITSTNFTRANVCRAAMEGATFGLRFGAELMSELGLKPSQVRLVGGGARSALWRQIVADVFECEVVCPQCGEAGALGAALQAACCATGEELQVLCDRFVRLEEERTVPIPENVEVYRRVYREYCSTERAVTEGKQAI